MNSLNTSSPIIPFRTLFRSSLYRTPHALISLPPIDNWPQSTDTVMWRGIWLLYCLFIDRLLAIDSDMELRDFKDISMNSGRRFAPFKLESTNDQDSRLDRTTTSIPRIALKDWMEKNPNLRKLAMFGTENQVLSDLEIQLEASEKKEELPRAEDDNFHHMYIDVNHTLFAQTDMPDEEKMAEIAMSTPRRMSTVRALSDKTNPAGRIPLNEFNEFATSTESNPFEVTEALMRDLTQIGENVFDTVVPSTESPIIDRPTTSIPLQSPTIPLVLNDISTQRPPYYRIPDTIGLQREATSSRIEGDATLSIPPKEFVNSNEVAKNIFDNDEDLPFIGDSTTFEIPTAPPQQNSDFSWNTKSEFLPSTFSFTPSPIQRDTTRSVISSFRHNYFGTTEPSVDPPSLEKLQKGFEREELVLFNSPDGTPLEGLNMNWSPLPSTTPKLLPRRVEKYHSGGMKRGDKKKKTKKRTKKIKTANYALSLNSQTATNFDMEESSQLKLDLERELRLLNKEQEHEGKSRTKGSPNQKVNGVSKSWGRSGGGRKHKEMDNDPMFAMEMEVVRTKKLREQMNWDPANRKDKRKLHKKFGRTSAEGKSTVPLSQARMVSRGDRMIEQRVTMIGGQKVTVDLANPILHGADLMMNPGAIIHDLLESNLKTEERKEIDGDIFPSKWKGREQSSENETPSWNDHRPHYKYIGEFAESDERVISNIEDASRIEIETFDGSQFDRPSKCCDENIIDGNHKISKGEVESLDALLIPLNSDRYRRTQTTSMYGQVNDLSQRGNSSNSERYIVKNCFEEKRNCYLIDASPMERRIGLTSIECLRFCSRVKGCLSVSFASTLSICDIYNIRNGTGAANLVQLLGYMYYEPKVTEVDKCMSTHSVRFNQQKRKNIRRSQAKKRIEHTTSVPIDPMVIVNAKRSTINLTMATRARCPSGEEMLFIRSRGIRDNGGRNLDTVLNINEDDCIFSCISNLAGYYDIFDCLSAQYDSYNEACTLSSDAPKDGSLSLHSSTNFYEKMCTKSSITSRCSGGKVERKRQKVLTGLLRDSITVGSALECIERCIDVNVNLPFKCMSIAYYYEEVTFNCVLNDGSALSHPDSLFDETSSVVDYFGIDECHGIKEITHRISDDTELRSFVHDGGLIHKRAERPLPQYEQARI